MKPTDVLREIADICKCGEERRDIYTEDLYERLLKAIATDSCEEPRRCAAIALTAKWEWGKVNYNEEEANEYYGDLLCEPVPD